MPNATDLSPSLLRAISLLDGGSLLAVVKEDESTYCERGISALFSLAQTNALKDASVADVIIGKAAALLLVAGGAKEAYGRVMSEGAMKVLSDNGVPYAYSTAVVNIINRRGDGLCPMEIAVLDVSDPRLAVEAIRKKLASLAKNG